MKTTVSRPMIGRFMRDGKATVAIIFALASAVMVLVAALAVNYSLAASTRQKMQAALDASVIAGVTASSTQTQTASITVAKNYFTNNLPSVGAASASFSFNADGSLSGVATYTMPMIFNSISGANSLGIVVTAKAAAGSNPVCILLLSASASPGLLANGGMNVNGSTCEADIKSTGNPAITFNSGSTLNMKKTCLQGTNTLINGGTHPNFSSGCSTASNPYVGKLPAPASTTCVSPFIYGGNYNGGTVTLLPGVYCGGFNFNSAPTVNLMPGVYVIKNGSWNVNGGKWTGTGVTFYFADTSNIQFNSGMDLTLTAPTSGTYAGILFYEPDGLSTSPFIFDDSVQETLSGLIYLPSRNITWNSVSNQTSPVLTLIANTGTFDTMNWSLSPEPLYPITNGSGGSGSVRLTQ